MKRKRFAVGAAVVALLLGAGVAAAAAPFDHASPGPEVVVATVPPRVDIYTKTPTSSAPGDTQAIVTGPDGRQADTGESTVDPADHHHVWVTLRPDLPPGRYLVLFKTRGETDLEQDGGTYAFYAGTQPSAADRAADKLLKVSNLDSESLSLKGYQRGIIEGGIPLVIITPFAFYWMIQKQKKSKAETPKLP